MAIQFPSNPSNGQVYNDPSSGFSFIYDSATDSWDPYNLATFVNSTYFTSTLSNYALLSGAQFTGNVSTAGKFGINIASPQYSISTNAADAFQLPRGNTAQKPAANAGLIRYNTQTDDFEVSSGNTWYSLLKPTEINIGNGVINDTIYTGTANNATYFDGLPSSYFIQASDLAATLIDYATTFDLVSNLTFYTTKAGNETITGFYKYTGNVEFANTSAIIANSSSGNSGQVLTTNGSAVYWSDVTGGGGNGSFTNGQSISVNNFVITGAVTANSSNGSSGQILTTNGSAVYWSTVSGSTSGFPIIDLGLISDSVNITYNALDFGSIVA